MDLKTKARNQKYIFNHGQVNLLEVIGPDARDFLNRLSTINFKKDFTGSLHGAFLNGQAKLISIFTVFSQAPNQFTLFMEPPLFESTLKYLEQMHFAEDFKIKIKSQYCLEFRNCPETKNAVDAYNWGLPGKYLFSNDPLDALQFFDHTPLQQEGLDMLRALFGYPKPLVDITQDHLFIEAPLEDFIDRHKGCYPGQEVIEKVFTYGRLPRRILPVQFSQKPATDLPMNLLVGDETVGFISSLYQKDNQVFGMATLKRIFLEKNKSYISPSFEMVWSLVP